MTMKDEFFLKFFFYALPIEVANRYMTGEEKLRKELQLISLEVHKWRLKSIDMDRAALVKLYCKECYMDFRGTNGCHMKHGVANPFSKF